MFTASTIYPSSLGYKGMCYPFLFVIDEKAWAEIQSGEDNRDEMIIFGGSYDPVKKCYQMNKPMPNPTDPDQIIDFLESI